MFTTVGPGWFVLELAGGDEGETYPTEKVRVVRVARVWSKQDLKDPQYVYAGVAGDEADDDDALGRLVFTFCDASPLVPADRKVFENLVLAMVECVVVGTESLKHTKEIRYVVASRRKPTKRFPNPVVDLEVLRHLPKNREFIE